MNFNKKMIEFIRGGFDKNSIYLAIKINKNFKNFELQLNLEGENNTYSISFLKSDSNFEIMGNFNDIEANFVDLLEVKLPIKSEFLKENNLINFYIL